MRAVLFCHSLRSDWNHGNAHFLRGIATELITRGHEVAVYEPRDGWSASNLAQEYGLEALERWRSAYPLIETNPYAENELDLSRALDRAELVIVHEWNSHSLIEKIGRYRHTHGIFSLFFHDTHHRSLTDPEGVARFRLEDYDGVLAFGSAIRDRYIGEGWGRRAWAWHEAADIRVFQPLADEANEGDLVWIGNWGDEERTRELKEFLIDPARVLGLRTRIHGVRYPESAQQALAAAGLEYSGWLPNYEVPKVFARYRFTVHVPRRPYAAALPGVPTIRVFEALACGIPLISAPWNDTDQLFTPGRDFLVAKNGEEMKRQMRTLIDDPSLRAELASAGLETIRSRHTCAHRVDELLNIHNELRSPAMVARGVPS
jgi:spore maturation protein CgeB